MKHCTFNDEAVLPMTLFRDEIMQESNSPSVKRRDHRCGSWVEQLEARRLFASAQIHFLDFSSTSHLASNGFSGAINSGNKLRMTDGVTAEARSVWYDSAVPIGNFRCTFSYRVNSGNSADGLCFVVQNGPTNAVGADGNDLGYAGIGQSEAACMNLFNVGAYGSHFGFAENGASPVTSTDMAPVDLHSGHLFHATVLYDGTTLTFAISDARNRSQVFKTTKAIDLESVIGSDTAIVGFTAGTGSEASTQDLTSWQFTGTAAAPTVATPASATPNPASGTSTGLSALGADAGGEAGLTYNWSLLSKPTGATSPTFSANGTNGAKSITAQFFQAGRYKFRCTITNGDDVSTTTDVVVNVSQVATKMRMKPHAQVVATGATIQYSATILDQFNKPLRPRPAVTYSIKSGAGLIGSTTGLFTASGSTPGHVIVQAAASGITGVCGVTVTG